MKEIEKKKHLNEEQMIAYRFGEEKDRSGMQAHLADCPECSAQFAALERVLSLLDTPSVPQRDEHYGQRVWRQIAPRLPQRRASTWQFWSARAFPHSWAIAGAMAVLVIAAYVAGRLTPPHRGHSTPGPKQVRERILIVAVGDHLDRSEMVLVELSNAVPNPSNGQSVDISSEQRRAEDLLDDNRLYRQTALESGDATLASVLEELERVLLDVAHSPDRPTPAQFKKIRQRIESQGILFKVRVTGSEMRQREKSAIQAPQENPKVRKGNHT
ncbi:MAG TPA: hypothetical protein VOA41_20535 [Candidatus Dormibacteraeota bacterium]|nr:hypothetical protein [Candidatus Dormibacteraeota bacterium]